MSFTYLASPYSKYPHGREEAFKRVCAKAAELMLAGEKIFCPIAHSHPIEQEMAEMQSGDFWLEQDFAILQHANLLKVYCMEGWEESIGVGREVVFAHDHGIPIEYVD